MLLEKWGDLGTDIQTGRSLWKDESRDWGHASASQETSAPDGNPPAARGEA